MTSPPAKNKISVSVSASASSLFSPASSSMPSSKPNPKPRNSETGELMRRSYSGNPIPADTSRRNSVGRECNNRVEFGDKENQNEKDLISSVIKGPKGSKHFMSPTISAVSKINPSPRKKILSDKNELSRSFDKTHQMVQVKSSVSFSDVISTNGEDKDLEEIRIPENNKHDITVTDLKENIETKRHDDSSIKISLLPNGPYTFPKLHEVVDGPLVAPYDPKKNFLSPRPEFLHYKPNPRIEHRFDECKQLDELFNSESSSSDTDFSAEERQQEEEVTGETQDEGDEELLKEPESDEEGEEVASKGIEEEEEEEETHQISNQSLFKRSKFLGWTMVLGVLFSVLVSSVTFSQPSIIEDSPFYQFYIPPEIVMSTRESFKQLGTKMKMCAESSLVYIHKLISSLREEDGYGPFQFHDMTDFLEDEILSDTVFQTSSDVISVAGSLEGSHDWNLIMDIEEENVGHQGPEVEPKISGEIKFEAVYEEDGNEVEQECEGGEVNTEMVHGFDEQAEIMIPTDTEVNGSESIPEEGNGGNETDDVEGQREYEENDHKNIKEGNEYEIIQNDEKNLEESESNAHEFDNVESSTISDHQPKETELAKAEAVTEQSADIDHDGNEVEEETGFGDGNEVEEEIGFGEVANDAGSERVLLSNQKKVVVVFSTVMVLLASAVAAGFLLAKKKKKPVKLQREDFEPTTISATKLEHVSVENLIKERLSSLNFKEEELFRNFSFSKNKSLHSCRNNRDDLKEYQIRGGGKKSNDSGKYMDSSASEYSIGSFSNGSFTTYEKIQKRSGHKEKVMITTPVRRSHRIKNHQRYNEL